MLADPQGKPLRLSHWQDVDGALLTEGAVVRLEVADLEPCPTQPLASLYRETYDEYLAADEALLRRNPLRVYLRDNRWYIRDGRHRWMAMKARGLEEVDCLVVYGPSRRWNDTPLRWWYDTPESKW